MDIVYARGEATASAVLEDLPDAPTRTSVRTLLRILEAKGHLKHKKTGREFVYVPARSRQRAGQSAFQRVLRTFFGGSLEKAVAAHLADKQTDLSPEALQRLAELVRQGGKEKGAP